MLFRGRPKLGCDGLGSHESDLSNTRRGLTRNADEGEAGNPVLPDCAALGSRDDDPGVLRTKVLQPPLVLLVPG